jgi:hypothetical protein
VGCILAPLRGWLHPSSYVLRGSFCRPFGAFWSFTRLPTAGAVGCILAPLRGWPSATAQILFDFRTNPYYDRDLVRCRRQRVAFSIVAEKSKLEWWFTGSILLLAISILGFAYLFWESYLVTKR